MNAGKTHASGPGTRRTEAGDGAPTAPPAVDRLLQDLSRIWDEGDVGLIRGRYAPDCVVHTPLDIIHDRETQVRDTLQWLVEFPERPLADGQPVWQGSEAEGYDISQVTDRQGRHTEYGRWGAPTGRGFHARTISQYRVVGDRIREQWTVRDLLGVLVQLGIDPHRVADVMAHAACGSVKSGPQMTACHPPLGGQSAIAPAHSDDQARLLGWLDGIYNDRMFGRIRDIYAPDCTWHGPLLRERSGAEAVLRETMRLRALIPDGPFVTHHIVSTPCENGDFRHAVRWALHGHHLGYGSLGAPTGHSLAVAGVTHFHIRNGKIREEWVVYDELSLLVQIRVAALKAAQTFN